MGDRQPAMVNLPQQTSNVLRGVTERPRMIQRSSYGAEMRLQGWWPPFAFGAVEVILLWERCVDQREDTGPPQSSLRGSGLPLGCR